MVDKPAVRIALAYLALAGLWIVASDKLLEIVVGAGYQGSGPQTLKGLFFVVVTSVLLYLAQRRARLAPDPWPATGPAARPWAPLLVFLLGSLGLTLTGLFMFQSQSAQIRAGVDAQLTAVGELRIKQIGAWLLSVRANARHFGNGSQLAEDFAGWVAGGGRDPARLQRIVFRIGEIRDAYGYSSISLFDTAGDYRLGDRPDPRIDEHRGDALRAMRQGKPLLVDFHDHGDGGAPMLGMMAPLRVGHGQAAGTVGAIFFSIPARTTLFPLLSKWPGASASGETVLARGEGTSVRLLYASRLGDGKALGPTFPLQQRTMAAARILRGERGILPGASDYRQTPIQVYGDLVPDTPWALIVKRDQAEVDDPVRMLARTTAWVMALLLAAMASGIWLWWRAHINRQRARSLGQELQRQILERELDTLSRFANDVILLLDADGRILEANERVVDAYGYQREEVLGQRASLFRPTESRGEVDAGIDQLFAQGHVVYEALHERKDGSQVPVEISARAIEVQGLRRLHLIIRDISERKRDESEIRDREARYRSVIETSPDGFYIMDTRGRIRQVNDTFCRLSGYRREDLLGMAIGDLEAKESAAETARHLEEMARAGNSLFLTLLRAKDGTVWEAEINANFLPRDGGVFYVFARDVRRRSRSEALLRTRLQLSDLASPDEIMQAALDSAELFTGSGIGFFHLVEADQEALILQAWSSNTLNKMCNAEGKGLHYPVSQAGVWADCIRERRVLFHNDYASLPGRKGMPEGHAEVVRELVVPILRDERVVAVLGVGNKKSDYTAEDAEVVEQIAALTMDMVQRRRAEEALAESEALLRSLVESLAEGVLVYGVDGRIQLSNSAATRILGLSREQLAGAGQSGAGWEAVSEDLQPLPLAQTPASRALRDGASSRDAVIGLKRPDGAFLWLEVNVEPVRAEGGAITAAIVSFSDISARRKSEERLRQAATVFENTADGIMITDAKGDILAVNRAFSEITGYADSEVLGRNPSILQSGRQDAVFYQAMWEALRTQGHWRGEIWDMRRNGELYPEWLTVTAVGAASGSISHYIGVFSDLSALHSLQERLEHITYHDPLTGLHNAHWLLAHLRQAIAAADANNGRLALLVLNIDRFAQLNDSLGRAAGDHALVTLGERWARALPAGSRLVRLDADQFAVLQEQARDSTQAMETAVVLRQEGLKPIEFPEVVQQVTLTLSIGIALYPGDATGAEALLHNAEDALRSAKAGKGNQVRFFDRVHAQQAVNWFQTEHDLRMALERDEFILVYQPQVDTGSGRPVAVEALLRWQRGDEVVPPGRFIHVVENTDLAQPVSRWVLQAACRQARAWLDRERPLRVAVNIFSDHVTSGRLADDVRQALEKTGLPPHLLELEVVESSLLANPEAAALTLRELKRLGVGLALDDFGTGYSSLGYLKHYPFDVLKIDQMFTRSVNRAPEDAAIVRSTITLANNLGMRVMAEGVETEAQLRFVTRYGCDQVQGYLLCRPTSPEAVEALVLERRDLRPPGVFQASLARGVLVVEDEPAEAEFLRRVIGSAGYRVYTTEDLNGALEVMDRERVDLILSDHYLRDTTGVEVLSRLQRLFPDIPRIMVSGATEQAVVIDALNRCGILAFVAKPVQPIALLTLLRKILGSPVPGSTSTAREGQ